MERKWVFLSVLMHAALLLSVSAAYSPVQNRPPESLVVHLIPAPAAGAVSDNDVDSMSEIPSVKTPVQISNRRIPEDAAGRIRLVDPEPAEPSPEESRSVVPETAEGSDDDGKMTMLPESAPEREDRIIPADIVDDTVSGIPGCFQGAAGMVEGFSPNTGHQVPDTALFALTGGSSFPSGIPGGGNGMDPPQPGIISLPEPVYPVLSRRLGEEGRVVVEVRVSAEGELISAKITDSSLHERLDRSALMAVERAVFRPAVVNGIPIASERVVAYLFRLEE